MPVPSFDGAGIFLMDDFLVVSSSDDDIEYHGDAEDGGYGVEGHHYGWYDAEQVTCQRHDGSGEDGGGQQLYVVAGAEHEAGYMGRGETQECHRTAVGCRYGCQDSCGEKYHPACLVEVDTQILGVVVAEKQGIERFYECYCQNECQE